MDHCHFDQMLVLKASKSSQSSVHLISDLFQKSLNIWDTFLIKFVIKTFQKLSNLVALATAL